MSDELPPSVLDFEKEKKPFQSKRQEAKKESEILRIKKSFEAFLPLPKPKVIKSSKSKGKKKKK
jgi:hypothetical protein